MDERPERSRWVVVRRIAKVAAVITTIFGVVTFPLTIWSTAEFASQKNWLWRGLGLSARDWFIAAKESAFSSPWIPAFLVLVGVAVFSWMVILDRRDRKPAAEIPANSFGSDVLDAIVKHVLTTPESRVRLRDALQQQGVTINIGTINVYADALRQDGRVEVMGPPDDPEIVPVPLHEQGRATDQLVVKKEDVAAPTASTQPSTVQADDEDEADENNDEEEEEEAAQAKEAKTDEEPDDGSDVEAGPWLEPSERQLSKDVVRHRQRSDGLIELLVRNVPALNLYEALSCEVDDPNQVLTTCRLRPRTLSAVAVYPFEESPPLVDGTYFVRWQVLGLASVLFPRVLGQDSFTIKNGRLVR